MISTATVSPSARPKPSIDAAMTPLRPNGKTVMRITSHLVAPSACAASICGCGACRNTSRDTDEMIGRIITASTTPAVNTVPPPTNDTLPFLNRNNQPRSRLSNSSNGSSCGASTKIPHSPKMIEGTAASRSIIAPNGRDNCAGAYWVRNTAIPTATGTANTRANNELSNVTMNRSRIPNARFSGSVVSNWALVKKFVWFARSDGTAWISRNIAINTMAITTVKPAATATDLNSRSPRRAASTLVTVDSGVPGRGGDRRAMNAERSGDGVDRIRQLRLELVGDRDIPVVRQALLARADGGLQEGLHRGTDLGVGVLRADDLIRCQHDRVGAGLRRLVERVGVEH